MKFSPCPSSQEHCYRFPRKNTSVIHIYLRYISMFWKVWTIAACHSPRQLDVRGILGSLHNEHSQPPFNKGTSWHPQQWWYHFQLSVKHHDNIYHASSMLITCCLEAMSEGGDADPLTWSNHCSHCSTGWFFLTGSALKVLEMAKSQLKKWKFELKLPISSVRCLYFHFFGRDFAISDT